MASQNQIIEKRRLPFAESETSHQTPIPGWRPSTETPSVKDVYPDLEYVTSLENNPKPEKETPLPLPPSTDWTDSFKIPWGKVPKDVMNCLSKKRKLDPKSRFQVIHAVCDKIFEFCRFPQERELEIIAKEMCKKFPASLYNGIASRGKSGNEYKQLAKQLCNRFKFLRKKPHSKSAASSVPSYTGSISPYAKSVTSPSYNSIMPSARSYISSAVSDSSSTKTTNSLCPFNRDCASPVSSDDGDFIIPWHKLDKTLLESLNKKEKLSTLQRHSMIQIVCNELKQWLPHPSNVSEEVREIAKRMVKKYPASLSNANLGLATYKNFELTLAKLLRIKMDSLKNKKKSRSSKF